MAWLTTEEFADMVTGTSTSDLPPDTLPNCLRTAKSRIRKTVADATMAEVEAAADDSEQMVFDLRKAQEYYARAELLTVVTGKMREGGVPKRERDENDAVLNEYEDWDKTQKRIAYFENKATELVTPYMITEQAESNMIPKGYSSTVKVVSDW